jgi:hypothetical protein
VELEGFKTSLHPDLRCEVDSSLTIDIVMEVGDVSENVTVVATGQTLNRADASLGNTVNSDLIDGAPLEARNMTQLLTLQPGVTPEGYVSGSRADQSNVTLDGIDANDQFWGDVFAPVLRVTPDSVQEFRVVTSNPTAAQGRSSGAQISLITRTGSSEFHGSVYAYHRNTLTSANNFFNNRVGVPRPKLIRNVFGARIGGPIVPERAFFFFNYEGRKDRKEETAIRWVPLPHLGEGRMFYGGLNGQTIELGPDELAQLYPATGGVNPAALAVYRDTASRYRANDSTWGDGYNYGGFRFNNSIPLDWNSFSARVDLNLTDDQTLFLRGNYQWDHESFWGPRWPDSSPTTWWLHPLGIAAGHAWTISPALVNTFRYGLTRMADSKLGNSTQDSIWITGSPSNYQRSQSRTTPLHQFTNDTSWIVGSHTFQFGANIRLIDTKTVALSGSYDAAEVSYGLYELGSLVEPVRGTELDIAVDEEWVYEQAVTDLLGRYTYHIANLNYGADFSLMPSGSPRRRAFSSDEYEFYFEDSWQARPSLTLNLGLRWGVNTPVSETSGFQVQPTVSLASYFDRRIESAAQGIPMIEPISTDLAGPFYDRPGYYATDWNNFSPRFSIAYSPSFQEGILNSIFGKAGQSVLRGGFAITYDHIGSVLAMRLDGGTSLNFSSSLETPYYLYNVTDSPGPLFTGFDQDLRSLALPEWGIPETLTFPMTHPMDAYGRIENSLDDSITTPINYTWNVSFGRELPFGLFIEASYLGRSARNLLAGRDVMHFNNLVDPVSGQSWYEAAAILMDHRWANTPLDEIPTIPFFENLFPSLGNWGLGTPSEAAYWWVAREALGGLDWLDWTWMQFVFNNSGTHPFMFMHPQYGSLGVKSTIARSDYHALTATIRKRFSNSLSFDLNYTWSKSMDNASGGQVSGSTGLDTLILNPLSPDDMYAVSGFDTRHIVNSIWLWELPLGRDRKYWNDLPAIGEALLGGWSFNGIFRWNSGRPLHGPHEYSRWATNWVRTSWNTRIRDPKPRPHKEGEHPNYWDDPQYAWNSFRDARAGETGDRNVFRDPCFFTIDIGLHKSFTMPYKEQHRLIFGWEVFNVTNTQRLSGGARWGLNPDPQIGKMDIGFGNIDEIQGHPRVMQFSLRYEF